MREAISSSPSPLVVVAVESTDRRPCTREVLPSLAPAAFSVPRSSSDRSMNDSASVCLPLPPTTPDLRSDSTVLISLGLSGIDRRRLSLLLLCTPTPTTSPSPPDIDTAPRCPCPGSTSRAGGDPCRGEPTPPPAIAIVSPDGVCPNICASFRVLRTSSARSCRFSRFVVGGTSGERTGDADADAAGELAADSDSTGVPHPPPGVLGDRFVAGVDVDVGPRPWNRGFGASGSGGFGPRRACCPPVMHSHDELKGPVNWALREIKEMRGRTALSWPVSTRMCARVPPRGAGAWLWAWAGRGSASPSVSVSPSESASALTGPMRSGREKRIGESTTGESSEYVVSELARTLRPP